MNPIEKQLDNLQDAVEDHARYACDHGFDPEACTWCRVVYEAARLDGAVRSRMDPELAREVHA